MFPVGLLPAGGVTQYTIGKSVRFRKSASAYAARTFVAPTANATWSLSLWIKRGLLTTAAYQSIFGRVAASGIIYFDPTDHLVFWEGAGAVATSTAVFRDPGSHYHLFVRSNGTNIVGYINGVQVISYASTILGLNTANIHYLGVNNGAAEWIDGLYAETYFVDGQALTPSSFGATDANTGAWIPIRYTGTYGNNGFYLDYNDSSSAANLFLDRSGGSHNWTPTNVSVTAGATMDSLADTPTNSWTTLNPLQMSAGAPIDANLTYNNTLYCACSTTAFAAGKWVIEGTLTSFTSANIGVIQANPTLTTTNYLGRSDVTNKNCSYSSLGNGKWLNGVNTAYGASYTTADVIRVELNMDAGPPVIEFFKNGTTQGQITLTTGFAYQFAASSDGGSAIWSMNFGQRAFIGTPTTGFLAPNSFNAATPTIKRGDNYMGVNLRTGTGAAFNVTSSRFQPDFVWIKSRSAATDYADYDSTRGVTNDIATNTTAAQTVQVQGVTAFGATGYTGGTLAKINTAAATYVDWLWRKGATPGFDIVNYAGTGVNRTVAHSLGVAPSLVIVKDYSGAGNNWAVWHAGIANTEFLLVNTPAAKATGTTYWNSTTPTSSVFSVGTSTDTNQNARNYIAYLFASVAGFSQFGSYTGNGVIDGPFIYCGFRPRYIFIKNISGATSWEVFDSSRNPFNVNNSDLTLQTANAETTATSNDFVANGFKIRDTAPNWNASGLFYIYAAFAENPFKYSNAR